MTGVQTCALPISVLAVARDSQHSHGNAIDFFVPSVPTQLLHSWAKAQSAGGVGLYAESGFVHMDTGPIRYWSGE